MHKHSRLQKKKYTGDRKEWCMFKHIYTCSTFCMHSSYKPIRNSKFVYVLFTANSIKQQDYGQIQQQSSRITL